MVSGSGKIARSNADFSVWCWGWDGAGDIDGPDVDPIWEKQPDRSYSKEAVEVKHFRNLPGYPAA